MSMRNSPAKDKYSPKASLQPAGPPEAASAASACKKQPRLSDWLASKTSRSKTTKQICITNADADAGKSKWRELDAGSRVAFWPRFVGRSEHDAIFQV